jgi:response regulator RpfG family c-di-GMP phosphodiesterase
MFNDNNENVINTNLTEEFSITPSERKRSSVLIVEPDPNARGNMKGTIKALGYGGISEAINHGQALDKLKERSYAIVLFDARKTNISAVDFLTQVLKLDKESVAIPMSNAPRIDDVFNLLSMGAKGFLAKPFTMDSVDESMTWAVKGEPIAEVVLKAKDRNEALVAMMIAAFDTVSTLLRQAPEFDTAKQELPKAFRNMKRAADLAKTFCKGTDDDLITSIYSFCLTRGEGPATKLGRLRKRLRRR